MRFLALRLIAIVPVLIGASIFSFSLTHMAPGDPVDVLLGPYASEDDRASLRSNLGLDEPLPVQYGRWIGNAVTGDLGRSIQMRSPVTSVLSERFVNTLRLGIPTFGLALFVGVAAGALAALRTDGLLDKSLQGLVIFAGTVPVFWLGLVLIYVFSIRLGWFPASGMGPIGRDSTIWESIRYLALPVLTTVGTPAAIIARSSRSAVLEVLDEDFVWAARGRGVRSPALFLRHILKPALPMVLHVSGLQFAYLIGGTLVFAEVVFSWPGIGLQTIHAVSARDIPVIQGVVLLAAAVTVITNLVVDIIHHYVDPRSGRGHISSTEAW
jgi:peptide/nickel transport system permease protein